MTYGTAIPPVVRMLLDFIAKHESGGSYTTVYRHKEGKLAKPITAMTLTDLVAAQAMLGRTYGSSAAGRYQHIRKTLLAQVKRLDVPMTATFSPGLQDDLGWDLLRQRGLDRFLAGQMSRDAFGNALAMEWASLPVLATVKVDDKTHVRGRSWYDGDGLNAAGYKPRDVETALDAALKMHKAAKPAGKAKDADWPLDAPSMPDGAAKPAPDPGKRPNGLIGGLIAASLASLTAALVAAQCALPDWFINWAGYAAKCAGGN